MLLTHRSLDHWASKILIQEGATAIETTATTESLREVHSEVFIRALRENFEKALALAAVAESAAAAERSIFYVGGSAFAGLNTPRGGHFFNAAVYIAKKLGAAVVSIDRHFPVGTWELHREFKFPLYAIYSGAEGPRPRHIAKWGHGAFALPMPPGAGDTSFKKVLEAVLEEIEGPLVIHLGFDIHREDPTGHFFVSENFYYQLGKSLAERKFYISLECPSTPAVFKSSLRALLAGISGGPPQPAAQYREGREVLAEVEATIERFKRALSDRLFRRH